MKLYFASVQKKPLTALQTCFVYTKELSQRDDSFVYLYILMRCIEECNKMSHDMRFPTMWHDDKCRHTQACADSFVAPNDVWSVA